MNPSKQSAFLSNAPSIRLPLQFMMTGVLSLVSGVGLLIAYPEILSTYHYNQRVISVTHLFVLGWLCSVVMGAMYQLVPVALETKLYNEKLGHWHFYLHLLGVTGLVGAFWTWNLKTVLPFGALLTLGVILFVYNLARTLKLISRWNVIACAIASSLFWLSFGVLAGLYIAAAKSWAFSSFDAMARMHAHAHLGAVGFLVQLLVGVSYKLLPMFALSEMKSRLRAGWSIGLLNIGLAGLFVAILTQHRIKLFFTGVIITALIFYGIEVRVILKARKRRALDWGLKYFVSALALFAPLSILALILSWPGLPLNEFVGQLENLYGFIAFMGVLTFAILGMLYKIIPFLVWYGSYSKAIGRGKVPALADLYSPLLQATGYFVFIAGFSLTSVGIVGGSSQIVRCGCLIVAASLGLFAVNLVKILAHLIHPKIEPLSMRPVLGNFI